MVRYLKNRWMQLILVGAVMAVAGAVVTQIAFLGGEEEGGEGGGSGKGRQSFCQVTYCDTWL